MANHFLRILDLSSEQAMALVKRADEMKRTRFRGDVLSGKTLVMLFEKASTRTRLSFEMAVRHLGGSTIFMTPAESQLGRSEPLKDTARVIDRYCDGMIVRTFGQEKLDELAEYGDVPVVNALSDMYHPCQVMSDVLTMYERTPDLENLTVAWVGDGNNMANSWISAAVVFPFKLQMAVPKGFEPDQAVLDEALAKGANITLGDDPETAVSGANYVNTDVFASMGMEAEQTAREAAFDGFQVNAALMAKAAPDAKFMHCLPAKREQEVTEEVLESPSSIVWDQAENRMHMQTAILEWLFTE